MSEELNTNPTGHELYATVDEAAEVIKSGITAEKVAKYDGYEESLGTKVTANSGAATGDALTDLTIGDKTYVIGSSEDSWSKSSLSFDFDEENSTVTITVTE